MKKAIIVPLVAALIAAGCANTATNSAVNSRVETNRVEAQAQLAATRALNTVVSQSDASYIPLRRIAKPTVNPAQAKTEAVQIEINQTFANLNEVAGVVSALTGIPVSVNRDVNSLPVAAVQPGAAPLVPPSPMPGGAQVPSLTGGGVPFGMPGSAGVPAGTITPSSAFTANYSGSLAGFMNLAATYYGLSWKADASGLSVYLLDSKTYRIAALPGDTRLNANVESASNTASSGATSTGTQSGGSNNSTGVTYSGLSVWTAMENAIKQMIGTNGKVSASPATGSITVTDTPQVLDRISAYVDEQNLSLNRQVSVNVRVLSVEVTDSDNYGINWDAVYSNLSNAGAPFSIAVKSAFSAVSGAGNMIISAPASSASAWAGSQAIISALSTQGRVSELTSATLLTLNNQVAPVNVGRRVSYLASSSSTAATATGGSPTVTLTPGTIQTGFSMSLVPHIMDSKTLLLQYNLDLSSLLQLKSITSGGSTIETPDISTSNFIQRVRMQSGETLVVAGFDHDNLSAVAKGIGSAQNAALGSREGSNTRTMLVVLIQPNIAL